MRPRLSASGLYLPALLVLGVLGAAMAAMATASLLSIASGGSQLEGPASLANYAAALGSATVRQVALTTFRLSLEITLLCIALGYPLAYVLARSPSAVTRRLLLFGLVAVMLSGGVTRAYAWLVILGNRGLINQLLTAGGLPTVRLMNNEIAVVIGVLNSLLPFFVLTLFGALRMIPPALEQAARNLGASRWRAFLLVTLPLSLPGVLASAALAFALSLSAFLFPQLLGGGRVKVIASLIYEQILTSFDIPGAAALALLFLAAALVVVVAFDLLHRMALARTGDRASS